MSDRIKLTYGFRRVRTWLGVFLVLLETLQELHFHHLPFTVLSFHIWVVVFLVENCVTSRPFNTFILRLVILLLFHLIVVKEIVKDLVDIIHDSDRMRLFLLVEKLCRCAERLKGSVLCLGRVDSRPFGNRTGWHLRIVAGHDFLGLLGFLGLHQEALTWDSADGV